jgi:hypothetical protein
MDNGPLNFSLSSSKLRVIGETGSPEELNEFIEKLKALIPILPELWPTKDDPPHA